MTRDEWIIASLCSVALVLAGLALLILLVVA